MLGVWGGAMLLIGLTLGWQAVLVLPLLVAGAWAGLRGTFDSRRSLLLAGTVMALLVMGGAAREASVQSPVDVTPLIAADRFEGRVASTVRTDLVYQRFDLQVDRVRTASGWRDAGFSVSVSVPAFPAVAYDDRIGLSGALEPVGDVSPGYRQWLTGQGLSGTVLGRSVWVEQPSDGLMRHIHGAGNRIAEFLRTAVPGDSGVLLAGLVVGDDVALSDDASEAFRVTGMSHITAVSGSNLALIVLILGATGGWLGVRRRTAWFLLVTIGIWVYAATTGSEPPVVRAALMATIALAAVPLGRRPDFLTAAVVSAAGMALVDPRLITSVGFQLSFVASIVLAAVSAGVDIRSARDAAWLAVVSSATAQVATLPVLLWTFGGMSPVSLLANLLIGPLVGMVFPLAFLASLVAIVVPPLGDALASTAGFGGSAILALVEALARLPGAWVELPGGWQRDVVSFVLAVPCTLLVSRDGRRWLGRAGKTIQIGVGKCFRAGRHHGRTHEAPLTPRKPEGIVSPGPHSLAAEDVTLSR